MEINKSQAEKVCKKLKFNLVDFSFFAQGGHNTHYLLETSKGKYVLRIEDNAMFKNLKKEYNLLKSLTTGLGPKVFLFDSSKKIIPREYMVVELLKGKHPSRKATDPFVISMAKWFKKLHSIKKERTPGFARKGYYSTSSAFKPFYRNYRKYKHHLDYKTIQELDVLFADAKKVCDDNDKLFGLSKKYPLLHGDCSRGNILFHNKTVHLIDWEFSKYNLKEWELVYFLQHYQFQKHHKKLFLKTYGYPLTKKGEKKLAMISLLNICSAIGYSVWKLDILKKSKKKDLKAQKQAINRVKKELRRMKKTFKILQ